MSLLEYDARAALWPAVPGHEVSDGAFFRGLSLTHRVQVGGSCVSTGLSLLTGETPDQVRQRVNTQDPVSWSRYLQGHGMKLAYCPTDLRRLKHHVPELLQHDDLFTLSTYSPNDASGIGAEPDAFGWVCGSHFVVLHRNMVFDTCLPQPVPLPVYAGCDRYVKRVFRVVPAQHERGL